MLSLFRFCIYESGDVRERKLNKNEKPLSVQSHWSSNSHYQRFVLRRATRSVSNQVMIMILMMSTNMFLQFPEETCVDDRSVYWSGSGYSVSSDSDSSDAASDTCPGDSHVFQPISAPINTDKRCQIIFNIK